MDKNTTHFNQQCYDVLKQIPEGKVTTYKEVARALNTRAWRAVGNAMAKNEQLVVIPCHRVIRSDGHIGHYASGTKIKSELLISEGISIEKGRVKNLKKYMHHFSK